MRIVNVRKGLQKFHAAAHSFLTLPHLEGEPSVIQALVAPKALKNVDAKHVDRIVQLDQPLLETVAYHGGALDIEIGLFSILAHDMTDGLLNLVEKLAQTAGLSFKTLAAPYVEPIRYGMDLLTGGADASVLEVGLSQTLAQPEAGWWVVLRATKDDIDPSSVRIADDNYAVTVNGAGIRDYPYFVFSIESSSRKDDWFAIPELSKAYNDLRTKVKTGTPQDVKDSLGYFRRVTLLSPDLVSHDRRRVVQAVQEEVAAIRGVEDTAAHEGVSPELRALRDIDLYATH